MFEDTLRALRQLAETQNTISFPSDQDGYFDRECPSPECMAQFKVLMADWKKRFATRKCFAPSVATLPMQSSGGLKSRQHTSTVL